MHVGLAVDEDLTTLVIAIISAIAGGSFTLEILDQPMLEIFRKKNYDISNLRILHVFIMGFFSYVSFYLVFTSIYFGLFSKTRQDCKM